MATGALVSMLRYHTAPAASKPPPKNQNPLLVGSTYQRTRVDQSAADAGSEFGGGFGRQNFRVCVGQARCAGCRAQGAGCRVQGAHTRRAGEDNVIGGGMSHGW